jgi:hypothetical protein
MLGAAGRTPFCSLDCLCAERKQSGDVDCGKLSRLGLRAVAVPSGRGQPTIVRSNTPKARKRARELAALGDLAATILSPPMPYFCEKTNQPLCLTLGSESFKRLADSLSTTDSPNSMFPKTVLMQINAWMESYSVAATFLDGLAGNQSTAYHNRLRMAVSDFSEIVNELRKDSLKSTSMRKAQIVSILRDAQEIASDAAAKIIEAICISAGIKGDLTGALAGYTDAAKSGKILQEMIYIARSGSSLFKLLAAMRLAQSDRMQSAATLRQLIYDPDSLVALAAMRSYMTVRPNDWQATFFRALEDLPVDISSANADSIAGLILHLSEHPTILPHEVVDSVRSLHNAWDGSKLISACVLKLPTI